MNSACSRPSAESASYSLLQIVLAHAQWLERGGHDLGAAGDDRVAHELLALGDLLSRRRMRQARVCAAERSPASPMRRRGDSERAPRRR